MATLQAGTKLWRIYFRDGRYPTTWDRMSYYGPVRSARFDHHLDPPGVQERGLLYAAAGDDAIATWLEISAARPPGLRRLSAYCTTSS